MKRILYTTDFSDTSLNAYRYALHLAQQFNAEIITLHAYQRPVLSTVYLPNTYQNIYEHMETSEFDIFKDTSKVLYKIAEQVELTSVKNTFIMIDDNTQEAILSTIENEQIDLVVMGTKGASGLKEIFIGSVTSHIMEKASCPVLGIPENCSYNKGIQNILFSSDFFPEEISALKYALDFSDNLNAHFECVNTAIDYNDYKQRMIKEWKEKLQFTKYKNVAFFIADTIGIESISKYIDTHDIDLIITTIYNTNYLEELFHFSLAKKLAHHSTIPVLTIPNSYKPE